MMKILYKRNGKTAIYSPTEVALKKYTIDELIVKSKIPEGYKIINDKELSIDTFFIDALDYNKDTIYINGDKAKEIAKDKIRRWRERQFKENDIRLQNALADEDKTAKQEAIKRRNYLRDLPKQCEGKTVDELKNLLEQFL